MWRVRAHDEGTEVQGDGRGDSQPDHPDEEASRGLLQFLVWRWNGWASLRDGVGLYFMSKPSNLSERLDLCLTVAWQKLFSLRGIGRCREPYSPEEGCGLSSKAPWPRS